MPVRTPQPKKARRIKYHLIAILLLLVIITASVSATPPPPDERAWNLLPFFGSINASIRNNLTEVDKPVPVFPNLSPYFEARNIIYDKTGQHYIAEVWYFTNSDDFTVQKSRLTNYLAAHGTISCTTLDITRELSQYSSEPGTAEYYASHQYPMQQIPVLEFKSNETSGYFLILNTKQYIAYYGIDSSGSLDENVPILKILFMSAVSDNLDGEFNFPGATASRFIPFVWTFIQLLPYLVVIGLLLLVIARLRKH
ncbi:hypothetical protein [Methanoregula sp.]|uniref:hypothetical protein n=1 Tax=Methanoregula sp. TaxID=2052170 RepID=UPI003C7625EC